MDYYPKKVDSTQPKYAPVERINLNYRKILKQNALSSVTQPGQKGNKKLTVKSNWSMDMIRFDLLLDSPKK